MSLLTDPVATPTAPAAAATPPSSGAAATATGGGQAASADPQTAAKPAIAAQQVDDKDGAAPRGAPEKYELKSPIESEQLDEGVLGHFTDVARELNLPNAAAQKLIDKLAPALREQSAAAVTSMVNDWEAASRADKEIGGDKLRENLAIAQKALSLGSPELRKFLGPVKDGGTGLGSHPEILRWALKVGKALSEDTFVSATSGGDSPSPKTLSERIYGPAKN